MNVPKYFKAVVVHFNLKLDCRYVSCGCGIPIPIASDFVKLIFKLESAPYISNSRSKFGREIAGDVSENMRSSAYAETLCWVSLTSTPLMSGFCLTCPKNGSSERANRSGESRHPCRVPLVIEKDSEVTPLALTLAVGDSYVADIQFTIFPPRPTCLSVANIKAQLTRSNAFSASVPMKTLSVLVCMVVYSKFRTLVVLSLTSLVGTKPT